MKNNRIKIAFVACVSALVFAIAMPPAQAQEKRRDDDQKESSKDDGKSKRSKADGRRVAWRQDVRHLPAPLKSRLVEIAEHPHSYLPLTAFSEAATPSQLFQYYLLDTIEFQPNIFTSVVPGLNDTAIPTAANAANGGLPTIGSVRVVLEPKAGKPTDPNDVRAAKNKITSVPFIC